MKIRNYSIIASFTIQSKELLSEKTKILTKLLPYMRVETYVYRKQSFTKDWSFPHFYGTIVQKDIFQLIFIN